MTRHSIHDVQHPTAENPDDGIVASAIDLTKVYGSKDNEVMALDHVNVEFKRGEMTAIMGPSGSGKSTLMHCMAGLDTPSSGKVIVEGLEVSSMNQKQLTDLRREQIGFIFQSFNLVPTLSAEENILLPLQIAKKPIDRAWFDKVVSGRVVKVEETGKREFVCSLRARNEVEWVRERVVRNRDMSHLVVMVPMNKRIPCCMVYSSYVSDGRGSEG